MPISEELLHDIIEFNQRARQARDELIEELLPHVRFENPTDRERLLAKLGELQVSAQSEERRIRAKYF